MEVLGVNVLLGITSVSQNEGKRKFVNLLHMRYSLKMVMVMVMVMVVEGEILIFPLESLDLYLKF